MLEGGALEALHVEEWISETVCDKCVWLKVVLLMTCQTPGISQVCIVLLTSSVLWEVWTAGTKLHK